MESEENPELFRYPQEIRKRPQSSQIIKRTSVEKGRPYLRQKTSEIIEWRETNVLAPSSPSGTAAGARRTLRPTIAANRQSKEFVRRLREKKKKKKTRATNEYCWRANSFLTSGDFKEKMTRS